MTHLSEEDLILLYYAEPDAPEAGRQHLAECGACRAAAESLTQTLAYCNELAVPERDVDFGRDAWLRLVPELDRSPEPARNWRGIRAWAMAAGVAVLLMAVFLAGRFSRKAEAPVMAGLSDQARQRILAIAVADHLDRVHTLMTEISHANGTDPVILATNKARAEDLVQEERLMRQSLAEQGEAATGAFLEEVEPFLVEAAHASEKAGAHAVNELRDRMESDSLLFKVRIVETNLRETLNKKEEKL